MVSTGLGITYGLDTALQPDSMEGIALTAAGPYAGKLLSPVIGAATKLPVLGPVLGYDVGAASMKAANWLGDTFASNGVNGSVDLAANHGTWGGLPATPAAEGFAEQLVRP